ncbi:MAG: hypothetical protein K2Q24_06480 [Chitinophagaceae bacterium]|jgi:hypothetical protein|nr:hypothetical protein [Chitinophagaceae bacterium]
MGLDLHHLTPTHQSENDNFLEYLSLGDLSDSPDFIARHANFLVDKILDEDGIEKVIFFNIKGYQRKGMRKAFYNDFKNDGIYFDLPSVLKAYNYLEADHINTLEELQRNFQQNFIDNFVNGESIFCVSW